ncbi:MAG: aldose epimerase family protein [Planctomycetaceae bacterium]
MKKLRGLPMTIQPRFMIRILRTSMLCGLLSVIVGCTAEKPPRSAPTPGVTSSSDVKPSEHPAGIQTEPVGEMPIGGGDVHQYIMTNANGVKVTLIDIGASITAVEVPDKDGNFSNVIVGFDDWQKFLVNKPYFGGICGQYAGRIAKGKFTLDGTEYTLDINNDSNHLHGGASGFNRMLWKGTVLPATEPLAVQFELITPESDPYPGHMHVTVTYSLNQNDELKIEYSATSDAATVLNLTNHAYWNLGGPEAKDVLDHELELKCSRYLPTDDSMIPTGEVAEVAGTPVDFTKPLPIGARIADVPGGYDLCYVIDAPENERASQPRLTARVRHPASGRIMEIETTEPGVQLYTGNFLDGSEDTGGYSKHQGFCLECQHFPDAPNHPDFPTTTLKPGEVYTQTTIHRFSVEK